MRPLAALAFVMLALVSGSPSISAHHSYALFQMDRDVQVKGVVTAWAWQNPHVHFTVVVAAGPGVEASTVGTWDIQGTSIYVMSRHGWTRATYKAGDPITVVGHPMKDGSKVLALFYAIRPDGSRLYQDATRPQGTMPPPDA